MIFSLLVASSKTFDVNSAFYRLKGLITFKVIKVISLI